MKKERLPRAAITIWRIRLTLIVSLCAFAFGAIAAFNTRVSAFLLFLTFFVYLYIFLFYFVDRYWNESYCFHSNTLCIQKGVYLKTRKDIFLDKIQYIKVIVSPIQKIFGLCTVYFFTAGESTSISQIEYKKILNIQKRLNLNVKNEI